MAWQVAAINGYGKTAQIKAVWQLLWWMSAASIRQDGRLLRLHRRESSCSGEMRRVSTCVNSTHLGQHGFAEKKNVLPQISAVALTAGANPSDEIKAKLEEQLQHGNIVSIFSNERAFAALLRNGKVITWGGRGLEGSREGSRGKTMPETDCTPSQYNTGAVYGCMP